MSGLSRDVRFALRSFARRPGFAAVAIVTLALGIGANAAIFSVVRGVLLRPLPYPDEERLVSFWYHSQGRRTPTLSQPELIDLQTRIAAIESAAGMQSRRLHLGAEGEPRLIRVLDATPELLPLLGVRPQEGRTYSADESVPDGPPVVVISQDLRRQLFGEGVPAVGELVSLSGVAHTVVGVMPDGFSFPDEGMAAYRPLRIDRANPDQRNNHNLWVVARLREGADVGSLRSEIESYGRWAVAEYPAYYSGFNASFDASKLRDTFVGDSRTPLLLVLGAVTLVLLVACANVANLLLARSEERRREIAVRLAVGAEQRHLVRQLLIESAILSLAGAAVALPLAWVAVRGLVALAGDDVPRLSEVAVDLPILGYTLGVSLLTSLVFGLAPLLRARQCDVRRDLHSGTRAVSGGRQSGLARRALVAVQVALAVVLITGGSLLTRTLLALERTDVGFATEDSLAVQISLPSHIYRESGAILAFVDQLEQEAGGLPGVTAAGVLDTVPLWQGVRNNLSLQVEGRVVDNVGDAPTAIVQRLSPGGLAALGLELRRGAAFTAEDMAAGRPVALVNETFVATVLRGSDPFASRVRMFGDNQNWMEIVGVVKNFRQSGVVGDDWPQLLVPFPLAERCGYVVPRDFSLLIAGAGAGSLAPAVRSLVRDLGPAVPIRAVRTLAEIRHDAVGDRTLLATLVSIGALLALGVATVGLYGVVTLWVSQRRRELGLRVALGARPGVLLWLVFVQAAAPVLVGAAIGVLIAVPLAVVLRGLLYGVSPGDPLSMLVVVGILTVSAAVAAALPARRATAVDPAVALRTE